ncbi:MULTISPECIES: hypothetical protein [unclassified Streptomyces]|uniref:hypothetical protein n=1 Tax=unclassified Streptomyces TaxID=2593676 RepID=UPI001F042C89|nr:MULTISPECIES: hypothetical protein [unclassified Streptomyces]
MRLTDPPATRPPAAYLLHHPERPEADDDHRRAMRGFAARLGVPDPTFYIDSLPRRDGDRPEFARLVQAFMDDAHRLLLIPGPWVLACSQARVRLAVQMLTAAGCRRILMLPKPLPPRWRTAPRPTDTAPGWAPSGRFLP